MGREGKGGQGDEGIDRGRDGEGGRGGITVIHNILMTPQ